jgi:2-keto-3-deoxy-L-rhamnonate aldolase RhmA
VPPPPFWPKPNRFRAALRNGGPPPVAMWITLQSPNVVELVGAQGVDTVILDLEHTSSTSADMHSLIVAAQLAGMTALVRPAGIDHHEIGRLLDTGAEGIVFPMVSSAAEAAAAARAVRYPPAGSRGWAGAHARHVRWTGSRPDGDGYRLLSQEFVTAADESVATVFMIENRAGVDHLGDILDAGSPDAVIFGWADFTVEAEFDAARVAAARETVYSTCRARGVGIAISVVPRDKVEYYPGCFFSAGVDATITSEAVGARLSEVRAAIATATGSVP